MRILVTGGAGFIGSNLVEALLEDDRVNAVTVLDNLSTGNFENIRTFFSNNKFHFIDGDIRDYEICKAACKEIDLISHQAALGSVPRSIQDPITTNQVNINGTLHIFAAAKEAGIKRIIYAASSSTYGDHPTLPKVEDVIGKPLSPYAITKYVNELYANVFATIYEMEFIGLRYFNVFGPKQNPAGPYAAVIPLFIEAVLNNEPPIINGDGSISRDFTYVANAVQANIQALFTDNAAATNQVYNIACGKQTTLLELYNFIKELCNSNINPTFREARKGDIQHSLANIDKARNLLKYHPTIQVQEGLQLALQWYKQHKN